MEGKIREERVDYTIKTPLGIIPRKVWLQIRYIELDEAIGRRLGTIHPILPEWLEERNELLKELKK